LSDKGDRAGAIGEYQKAIGLDPNLAPAHFELGLALADKGDLDQAAAEFREATALGLTTPDLRAWASQVERWRELAPRLSATAAGRGGPASPADKCELASLAARPFHRQYYLAVRLFQQAFAADPKCPLINRYRAACAAAQAAIGRDIGLPVVGVDEWGYLTGLAHEWVRAPLAALTTMAGDRKYWATVRQMVAEWKQNPDLMAVRDPAWLAAMPAADRERWQALWADVDALLAKVSPPTKLGR
jgi:tetratricopeptide (TPR) repeat protein